MIPLTRWLAERQTPPDILLAPPDIEEPLNPPTGTNDLEPSTTVDPSEREKELLIALKQAEGKLQDLLLLQEKREQEIECRLGEALRAKFEAALTKSFQDLLEAIEQSLAQVLSPFLNEHAWRKAVTDLTHMIREDMAQADAPVLEVRAPAALHDALRSLAVEGNIALTLGPSDHVEVFLSTDRRRFEDLSARWREAIEGARHE